MNKEQATRFFAILFRGEHHIPGEVKNYGYGWFINCRYASMATYDYDYLTKLVLMSHHFAVRAEIKPSGPGMLKICIWQRKRDGEGLSNRHPDIHEAIDRYKEFPETLN